MLLLSVYTLVFMIVCIIATLKSELAKMRKRLFASLFFVPPALFAINVFVGLI